MQFTLFNNTHKTIDFAFCESKIKSKSFYEITLPGKCRIVLNLKKTPHKIRFLKNSDKYIYRLYPEKNNYMSIHLTELRNLMINIGQTKDRKFRITNYRNSRRFYMATNKKIIIANWKANKAYKQALLWAEEHKRELVDLARNTTLIICPDFVTISPLRKVLPEPVYVGAQDCSQYDSGPWTGQIPPQSLADAGCSFCIIWHVETRKLYTQSPELIAQKIDLLNQHNIIPIVCVTNPAEAQSLFKLLVQQNRPLKNIIIGYEPEEAIGKEIISPEKIAKNTEIIKKRSRTFAKYPGKSCLRGWH